MSRVCLRMPLPRLNALYVRKFYYSQKIFLRKVRYKK